MKTKRILRAVFPLLSVLMLVALIFGCAGPQATQPPAAGGDVMTRPPIGVVRGFTITDLTGPTSDTCVLHYNGTVDYLKELNAAGGLVYNDPKTGQKERVTFEYDFSDCKAQAGPVPSQYDRLSTATPKPVIYFAGCTAASLTTLPFTERDHIVQLSGMSDQAIWWPPKWAFCMTPDYAGDACAGAHWAMQDWKAKGGSGTPNWAWFTLDIPFGRSMATPESEAYIKGLGFNLAGLFTMPFAPVDLSAELMSMEKAGVNYFYSNDLPQQEAVVMKNLAGLGLKDKMQAIGNPYAIAESILDKAGVDANGLVGVHFSAFPAETNLPGIKDATEMAARNGRTMSTDYALGLCVGRMLTEPVKRALEAKGYPITGDDVYQAMLDPSGYDVSGGIIAKVTWTETERRGLWITYMRGVQDGKIVRISEDFRIPDMKPQQ